MQGLWDGEQATRARRQRRTAVERQRSSDVSSFKRPYRHMYHRMCSQAHPLSLDIGANVPVRQVEEEEEEEEEEEDEAT